MIRRLVRFSCLSLLGLALASLGGCGEPNEADFKAGGPEREGVANPKYASDTPATYQQFHKDAMEAAKTKTKGKAATSPAPAPPAGESKPGAEPEKKEEPAKKG
jgi:hypothetical protein